MLLQTALNGHRWKIVRFCRKIVGTNSKRPFQPLSAWPESDRLTRCHSHGKTGTPNSQKLAPGCNQTACRRKDGPCKTGKCPTILLTNLLRIKCLSSTVLPSAPELPWFFSLRSVCDDGAFRKLMCCGWKVECQMRRRQ